MKLKLVLRVLLLIAVAWFVQPTLSHADDACPAYDPTMALMGCPQNMGWQATMGECMSACQQGWPLNKCQACCCPLLYQ
jgi:hypothetical protein